MQSALIVVHDGWFLERILHHDGEELIVSILGRGEASGLAEIVLSLAVSRELMAGSDSVVISVPWRAIVEMSSRWPDCWRRISEELARQNASLLDKLLTSSLCGLEGRIAAFLLDVKRIVRRTPALALTQGTIARAVGASRPKVNRCLKALERKGTIEWCNGGVPAIRDEAALRRLL
ncbi:MAG: family transcriptional regulator, cyclic receptor protein [Sphingomonadales bacterium]|jgi:CRP-like cAMP-binding protein|nr:family transcriptional regulator, cyclic receptor protein [Sphingomonadales bacterium]